FDVIVADEGPLVIDVNPRLVEPINALFSGVDLVGAMLELAKDGQPPALPAGKAGVRTRQLLLCVLGAAERGSRRAVLRELITALEGLNEYEGAAEELTPVGGDLVSAIPIVVVALATLIEPSLWRRFYAAATGPYSLT